MAASHSAKAPTRRLPGTAPANPDLSFAGRLHDLGSATAIGRQKNDVCPPNLLLRAAEVRSNHFKLGAAGSAQWDGPSLVHSSDESGSESISEWKGQILVHQLR